MSGSGFIMEFLRAPNRVGAIWPSSAALARTMVDWIEWSAVETVVEYGPGNGAFSGHIRDAMKSSTQYLAIEQSERFAAELRQRYPGIDVAQDTVANVPAICEHRGISQVDAVICGLPWAGWRPSIQESLIRESMKVMRPGCQFTTFAYLQGLMLPGGRAFAKLLERSFASVQRSPVVWRNMPPAFAYRCRV